MSRVLSFVMAFSMLLIIVPGSVLGVVARLLMLGAGFYIVASTFVNGWNFKVVEWRWAILFLAYLVSGVISAMFSPAPELGLVDAGRQFFIMFVTLAMLLLFRDESAVYYYRRFLVLSALLGSLTLIIGFGLIVGMPSLENVSNLAAFKYDMTMRYGINPNPLSFAVLLAFMLTWCSKEEGRPAWFWVYSFIVWISILLSGARTTLAIVAGAALIVFLLRKPIKGFALLPVGFLILAIFFASAVLAHDLIGVELLLSLSEFTSGRTELWMVAMDKFFERPWLGWGASTWNLDLWRYMSAYSSDLERWDALGSGAFHNAYLTHLAEKGLIGFCLQMTLLAYLVKAAFRLYWSRVGLQGADRSVAVMAPYLVVLVLLRSLSETGGLLGYANGGVDFMAYAAVGLILAVYSRVGRLES